eukprot:COSAG04_NODE_1106_length_8232_cov_4.848641_10_plen_273_part_00
MWTRARSPKTSAGARPSGSCKRVALHSLALLLLSIGPSPWLCAHRLNHLALCLVLGVQMVWLFKEPLCILWLCASMLTTILPCAPVSGAARRCFFTTTAGSPATTSGCTTSPRASPPQSSPSPRTPPTRHPYAPHSPRVDISPFRQDCCAVLSHQHHEHRRLSGARIEGPAACLCLHVSLSCRVCCTGPRGVAAFRRGRPSRSEIQARARRDRWPRLRLVPRRDHPGTNPLLDSNNRFDSIQFDKMDSTGVDAENVLKYAQNIAKYPQNMSK